MCIRDRDNCDEQQQQDNWGGDIVALKGKGKGKPDNRECFHCGRKGHIKANCIFKDLPQDQTPMGYHKKMVALGHYQQSNSKGNKGNKGQQYNNKGYKGYKGGGNFFGGKGGKSKGGFSFKGKGKSVNGLDFDPTNFDFGGQWDQQYEQQGPPVLSLGAIYKFPPITNTHTPPSRPFYFVFTKKKNNPQKKKKKIKQKNTPEKWKI